MKINTLFETKYQPKQQQQPTVKPYRPNSNDEFHQKLFTYFNPVPLQTGYVSGARTQLVSKTNPAYSHEYNKDQAPWENAALNKIKQRIFTGALDEFFKIKDGYIAFIDEGRRHGGGWDPVIVGIIVRHKNNVITSLRFVKATGGKLRSSKDDVLLLNIYKKVG